MGGQCVGEDSWLGRMTLECEILDFTKVTPMYPVKPKPDVLASFWGQLEEITTHRSLTKIFEATTTLR